MKASIADYATALYEAVADNPAQSKKITAQFLDRLKRDKQTKLLTQIIEKLDDLEASKSDTVIVKAFTAQALSEKELKSLNDQLTKQYGKKVALVHTVDNKLIGGIRLVIGDTTIDNSISQTINRLAMSLQKG